MKITIPIDVWDPRRGGMERYLALLGRSLHERGHDVLVLCLRSPDVAPPGDAPAPGVTFERVRAPARPRWLREIFFARRSLEKHRQERRDILFAVRHAIEADVYQPHGGSFRAAAELSLAPLRPLERAGKRLLRWLRPSYHVLCWLDRQVLRGDPAPVTISLSGVVEEGLRRMYPRLGLRFERIYNGIQLDAFHDRDREECSRELRGKFGIPAAARVALFLAHKFRAKGLAHAVRALGAAGDWHLVVGGRDRQRPYRELARSLGITARIHFAGDVRDSRRALAGADAFVLPTYYDSCSLSVLEALACGTPAITTRLNGASELIADGREGFVLRDPADEEALASGLRRVAADWDRFHAAALESATRFSWDNHVDRVEKILERRLEEKRGQAPQSD
jgi:UDP-glucose:(heptosyl)LPS alpha-1,3-glucosyltransferase